jgi:shikimate 5-dehydrogenase
VAFAARRLGLLLIAYNRTHERAQALAASAGGAALDADAMASEAAAERSLREQLGSGAGVEIAALVCTLPASAAWSAPPWLLARHRPAVLDACYRPRSTPLLRQARAAGCATAEGCEMLIAQGVAAFAVWTGLASRAGGGWSERIGAGAEQDVLEAGAGVPVAEMARAVYEALEREPGMG